MSGFRLHAALGPEIGSLDRLLRHFFAFASGESRVQFGAPSAVPFRRTIANVIARQIAASAAVFASNALAFVFRVDLASFTWMIGERMILYFRLLCIFVCFVFLFVFFFLCFVH